MLVHLSYAFHPWERLSTQFDDKVDPDISNLVARKNRKEGTSMDVILNNEDEKRSQWFYYDLDHRKQLYLKKTAETLNNRQQ